jgi:hypothetical protein
MVLAKTSYTLPRLPALFYWGCGAMAMFVMELLNGATVEFSLLAGLFTFATGLAIQACGGLATVFGLCTFIFATQHIFFSQIAKFVVHQQPELRLQVPFTTMGVYVVGMLGFAAGATLHRYARFNRGRPIFPPLNDANALRNLALVALGFALFRAVIVRMYGSDDASGGVAVGGFVGPIRQMVFFETLAVAAGTGAVVLKSNRTRSLGLLNLLPIALPVITGFLGANRTGFGAAGLTYLIAAPAFGFRYKIQHLFGFLAALYVMQFILSPYSLAARTIVRTPDLGKNISASLYLLGDVIANPGKYDETGNVAEARVPPEFKQMRYYGFANNSMDRFSMIKNADAIVAATVYRGTLGMRTIMPGFEMVPPSFLYDDKPVFGTSNFLAHRTKGLVNENDFVTGITIGLFADSYSSFEWIGVFIIPMLLMYTHSLLYGLCFSLTFKNNIYAVGILSGLVNAFSEGTISTHIVMALQGSVLTFIGLWFLTFVIRLTDATHVRAKRNRAVVADA